MNERFQISKREIGTDKIKKDRKREEWQCKKFGGNIEIGRKSKVM